MKYAMHAKHAIFWSMPRTSFYEVHKARHFYEPRQARKHAKFIGHVSMPNTRARKASENASTPFSWLKMKPLKAVLHGMICMIQFLRILFGFKISSYKSEEIQLVLYAISRRSYTDRFVWYGLYEP